jgi:hypothetical protein
MAVDKIHRHTPFYRRRVFRGRHTNLRIQNLNEWCNRHFLRENDVLFFHRSRECEMRSLVISCSNSVPSAPFTLAY